MEHPVVVVGAGFCGVVAVKIAREYNLNVICYEKTESIGGLWRYREDDIDGVPSVMKCTIIDTSKELEALSDFIMPAEFANNMNNKEVLQYMELYTDNFKLHPYFRFHHEVINIQKADNFSSTGEWDVHVRNNKTGEASKVRASAVMVATGHHVYPHWPKFQGVDDFQGIKMHSHSYKDFHPLENKRVLVVGMGNSGCDIAVDLSRVTPKLYLSTRRGCWVDSRLGENGVPFDAQLNTRSHILQTQILPLSIQNYLTIKRLNYRFDHDKYNLTPKHPPSMQHITFCDELPSRLLAGALTIKSNVHKFTANGVIFEGEESTEYPIDAVVFSTGYIFKFPFISEDVIKVVENRCNLYRRVFPMTIEHPTLAMIGLCQPLGALFPTSEMQSRWAVSIFLKKISLPPRQVMLEEQRKHQEDIDRHSLPTQRHAMEEVYILYMDAFAKDLNVKPNLLKLFFTDPKLFWAVFFGPLAAYQYRLQGPHSWPGARDAILTTWDRIHAPYRTNKTFKKENSCHHNYFRIFIFLSVITVLLYLFFA